VGLEPTTYSLATNHSTTELYPHGIWSDRRGSNSRRQAWKASILPLNYGRVYYLYRLMHKLLLKNNRRANERNYLSIFYHFYAIDLDIEVLIDF
jgi:hypothetical protein